MTDTTIEDLEAFRARARRWIESTLPSDDDPPADARTLQRTMFDCGFAGIPFPTEYGGAGLTLEHQQVFYDTAADLRRQTPTGSLLRVSLFMLGPTILDHGSDEAKRRFLPPLLRADEVWVQLLSEPRGGSDMAGATTRLTRDGDSFVLSGAKMWTTNANSADYGLCLCRSDWDVPKHRGLAMISVPLCAPGVTIGAAGVVWESEDQDLANPGTGWLVARGGTLAGGSNEMQRNIISERLLGFPREPSVDRDVPFRDVVTNQPKPS
ncbi:MAG: acyl-CoA dehydrogenase family protein [Acidimicrobiia bacterium]